MGLKQAHLGLGRGALPLVYEKERTVSGAVAKTFPSLHILCLFHFLLCGGKAIIRSIDSRYGIVNFSLNPLFLCLFIKIELLYLEAG